MTPLDTVSWEGMGGYNMGYLTKYTTPFRGVNLFIKYNIIINLKKTFINYFLIKLLS